jgi:hypothetical protein
VVPTAPIAVVVGTIYIKDGNKIPRFSFKFPNDILFGK